MTFIAFIFILEKKKLFANIVSIFGWVLKIAESIVNDHWSHSFILAFEFFVQNQQFERMNA